VFYGYGQQIGQGLIDGMRSSIPAVLDAALALASAATGRSGGPAGSAWAAAGRLGDAAADHIAHEAHLAHLGHLHVLHEEHLAHLAAETQAGGVGTAVGSAVHHVHVHLNGREIFTEIQKQAVSNQIRTGHPGMQRRAR
jgi:hypothetical protein